VNPDHSHFTPTSSLPANRIATADTGLKSWQEEGILGIRDTPLHPLSAGQLGSNSWLTHKAGWDKTSVVLNVVTSPSNTQTILQDLIEPGEGNTPLHPSREGKLIFDFFSGGKVLG
jgi:hypothetical protein